MRILFITEILIYFISLSVILVNIFHYTTKNSKYLFALFCNIVLLLTSTFLSENIFFSIHLLFPIIQIFILYFVFPDGKLSSIIYAYLFIYAINTIFVAFISLIANIRYSNTLWVDFIVNTTVNILCIILCFTTTKIKIYQIKEWTPILAKRLIFLLLILSILLVILSFDNTLYINAKLWFSFVQKITFLTILLLLIIVGILICVMLSNTRLKQLTENYEQQINAQAEHYRQLAESTYEIRRFKHDFKNMSIAMEQLLTDEGKSEALELFKKYNGTLENKDSSMILFDTGNGIADALLADKQQKALTCNSKIIFEGAIPAESLKPTDICVILGNTLDNAIEACEKFKTPEVKTISVSCNCNSGFLFLSINNPVSESVEINDNHIMTTKKNKTLHGFGLYSLNSIIKNYDGNMELKATDKTFTIDIDLCLMNTTCA